MDRVDPAKPLHLAWVDHAAAKYACEHWHYSKCIPVFKIAPLGVWEFGRFVGVVIFSVGASPDLVKPYGLTQQQGCELTRVALAKHKNSVSKILSIAFRMLRKQSPNLRLLVSFADGEQGHHGGIYQAGGWVYSGSQTFHAYRVLGKIEHPKTLYMRYGVGGQSIPWLIANVDPNAERIKNGLKHRYLMPLDPEMHKKILPLAKPYPKRPNASASSEGVAFPAANDGAAPIRTLQSEESDG